MAFLNLISLIQAIYLRSIDFPLGFFSGFSLAIAINLLLRLVYFPDNPRIY